MTLPEPLSPDRLELKDAPSLIWIKVSDAARLLWNENPKLHDIGAVVESIRRHGFQEIPKYDSAIGIKAGNGRIEALYQMEKSGAYELPRGLAALKESGEWVMPLLIGTDAESVDLARAYAIDSNNLTLAGGDYMAYDIMRLWSENEYIELLEKLAQENALPVSVDGDVLDELRFILNYNPGDYLPLPEADSGEDLLMQKRMLIRLEVSGEHYEEALKVLRELLDQYPQWEGRLM